MSGKRWVQEQLFHERPADDPRTWLAALSVGIVQQVDRLDVSPLVLESVSGEPYLLLPDAIRAGTVEVSEQAGGGSVPEVEVRNLGERPVLILEGETLIGCKQNRVVARTVLAPPGKTLVVNVGCMERGRWRSRSARFDAGISRMSPSLRKIAALEVAESLRAGRPAMLHQGRLWRDVDDGLRAMGVRSDTGDYAEYLNAVSGRGVDVLDRLVPVRNQIGMVALHRGRLLGLELAGHPENWAHIARRTIPGYVQAAADAEGDGRETPSSGEVRDAAGWIGVLTGAEWTARPAAGLGRDLEVRSPHVVGAGLWHEGRFASLGVFAA